MRITNTYIDSVWEASIDMKNDALRKIELEHGQGGRRPKKYHNSPHTQSVIDGVLSIGSLALERGKIEPIVLPLLVIASSFHDIYYNPDFVGNPNARGENERRSALMAREAMKRYTFLEETDYDFVERAITSTTVTSFSPKLIQDVDPNNYAFGILADADLSSFGMPPEKFAVFALAYLAELRESHGQRTMQFLDGEFVLLQNHQWHTQEASELFPHIEENIETSRRLQTLFAVQ